LERRSKLETIIRPGDTEDQIVVKERHLLLQQRPIRPHLDRIACKGPGCTVTFPWRAIKYSPNLFLIDGTVYCRVCGEHAATGMLKMCLQNGFRSKAEYYKSIQSKIDATKEREKIQEAAVDEEVEMEDAVKMRKLMKDPGGAMETQPLRKNLYHNLHKQNLKENQKKIQVGGSGGK